MPRNFKKTVESPASKTASLWRSCRKCAGLWLLAAALPAASAAAAGGPETRPEARLDLERQFLQRLAAGEETASLRDRLEERSRRARRPASKTAAELSRALELFASTGRRVQDKSAGSVTSADLAAAVEAYESLAAADLLVRERFAATASRLSEADVEGEIRPRLETAEAAYRAWADPLFETLRDPYEALRRQDGDSAAERELRQRALAALAAVLPELEAAKAEPMRPILRSRLLPYRQAALAPRPLVRTPTLVPAYLDPTDVTPDPADRAPTPETPLTDEILEQARELGYDYVRLYELVRNGIETEVYAGSMKGALGTLRSGRGNDVDQASLLIALLRGAGAPARYVHGVVELTVNELAAELGLATADQVTAALARAGLAFEPVIRGGRVAAVHLEHTWVEAFLPYTNYRGAVVDFTGRSWIPLAPAIGKTLRTATSAILAQMGFDAEAFVESYLSQPQAADPLAAIRGQVEAWLADHGGGAYGDQLGSRAVAEEHLGMLPSSLPMPVVAITGEAPELDAGRRHTVRFVARAGPAASDAVLLDFTVPLAEVAGARVTLSYLPATVDDHQTVLLFGGLELVPAYLVELRPRIMIGGRQRAVGEPLDMATAHRFEVELAGPFGVEQVDQTLVSGAYLAVGLGTPRVSRAPVAEDDPADTERLAARLLSSAALTFSERWDAAEDELAALFDVTVLRPLPSVVLAANAVGVETVAGLPESLSWEGVTLDAALRLAEPVAGAAGRDWMRLAALHGSALEHQVFETEFLVESVSADKGLGLARQAGLEVLTLDAANVDQLLPTLDHPRAVEDDIEAWARAGHRVEVPREPLTLNAWRGSVWRVEDEASGAGGYFLAGGLAGGATSEDPADWVLDFLADALAAPFAGEPNPDPYSGARIRKVPASDHQEGVAGELLERQLTVLVSDRRGRPVKGAQVTFEVLDGNGRLGGKAPGVPATAVSNSLGIAAIPYRLGESTGGRSVFIRLEEDDEHLSQAGFNQVIATVESSPGTLELLAPFQLVALPGEPVALRRTDTAETFFNNSLVALWTDTMTLAAEDEYGNPVANVEVELVAGEWITDIFDDCSNPPVTAVENLVFFDATLDRAGAVVGCPAPHPVLGACGTAPLTLRTDSDGEVAAGVILGDSALVQYVAEARAAGLESLEFRYAAFVVYSSTDQFCEPWRTRRYLLDGFNGSGATEPGTPLPTPLEFSVLSLEPTSCDARWSGGSCLPCPEDDPECGYRQACLAQCGGEATLSSACESYCLDNPAVCSPYYVAVCDRNHWSWIESLILEESAGATVTGGGFAGPPAFLGPGSFEVELTAAPLPGSHEVTVVAESHDRMWQADSETGALFIDVLRRPTTGEPIFSPTPWEVEAGVFWGARPAIAGVTPEEITLVDGRATDPVRVTYEIAPAEYPARSIRLDLLANGVFTANFVDAAPSSTGILEIFDGFPFDRDTSYEIRLVVNPGAIDELRSPHQGLTFADQLLLDWGPSGALEGAGQSLVLSEEIDLANGRVCRTPIGLGFRLSRDADVTLAFRRVEAIETDGTQQLGSEIRLIDGQRYTAGEHAVPLTPDDLPAGDYVFELRVVDPLDGATETGEGTATSLRTESDSLPVGHTLIHGVDLWDGHLTLSRRDLAYAGRGIALDFRRSYSSHSLEPGPLGIGWSHAYLSQLRRTACGEVVVSGGEGSGMRFASDGAGGWRPLRGHHGTLIFNPDATFDLYTPGGTHYRYESLGGGGWTLKRIADPNGNVTELFYTGSVDGPVLRQVVDASGRALVFAGETRQFALWRGHVITSVTGPGGQSMAFQYDDVGHLVRAAREGDARVEEYAYEPSLEAGHEIHGLLVEAKNALDGGTTSYDYFAAPIGVAGRTVERTFVQTITHPEGGVTAFDYDLEGLAARLESTETLVTDRRGFVTTYTFNGYGSPLRIEDPLENLTTLTWAPGDVVMTSRTDANGTLTTFEYDEHGNVLRETVEVEDYDGTRHTYTVESTYVPALTQPPYIKTLLATRRDRNGHLTALTYDERGNLTSQSIEVVAAERGSSTLTTSHVYATGGDRLSTTDRRGLTTSFGYDVYGHLETVTDPLGHVTRTEWDARGVPVREVDALGRATVVESDTLGRVTRRVLPDELEERVVFDDVANRRTEIDAEGRSTTTHFDLEARVVRVYNAAGGSKVFGYDSEGLKTLESMWFDADTPRADVTYTYDDAGRLASRTEPLGRVTTYAHDGVGNVLRETLSDAEPTGFVPRVTEMDYDALNRVVTTRRRLDAGWVTSHTRYDGQDNAVLEVDALGRQTAHDHDAMNRRIRSTEPEGRVTLLAYDGNGNLVRTTLENGLEPQVRELVYDAADRLVASTDAEGHSQALEYDAVGNALREIDARGHVVSHEVDSRNRRTETTVHLAGDDAVTRFDYDGVGNLIEERPANGNVAVHIYDVLNRLTSTTDSLGPVASFDYDARGNRTAEIDARGHRSESTFDALDRLVRQDLPENRVLRFTYDIAGNPLSATNARDFTTRFEYDELNRVKRTVDALDQPASVTWDAVGNRLSETGRRGFTTNFEYDDLNRLVRRRDPSIAEGEPRYEISYTYDAAGNRLTELDRRGILTEHLYDRENRRLETKRDGIALETLTYDPVGSVASATDANGHTTTFEYDERGLVTAELRPLAATTRFVYDLMGDLLEARDPEDKILQRNYDLRRRVETETQGVDETTTFAYDLDGNRTSKTLPEGGVWRWEYDGADRLTGVIDPETNRTEYAYDGNDNLETQTDGTQNVTTFVYDGLDRQSRITYPDTAFEIRGYDAEGNLTQRQDPKGLVTTFAYDALGRETLRTFPEDAATTDDLQTIARVYDENNNVLETREAYAQTGEQLTARTYDSFDRLETVTDRWGNRLLYGYDANGNRTQLIDPSDQVTLYTYDALNRVSTVTAPGGGGVTTYEYFANSRLKKVTYPNGTSADYTYDEANRVEEIENRHNTTVLVSSFAYGYDANGNRLEQIETHFGEASETTTYGYDLADRLSSVAYPEKTVEYTYDGAGNRETERELDGAGTLLADKLYAYNDRNQLTTLSDAVDPTRDLTYGYDANGNQTSRVPASGAAVDFDFDVRDRLLRVEEDGLPIGTYRYDATGLRVSKLTAEGEARYVYDDRSVLLRSDADGTTKFEYGPDRLLSVNDPAEGRAYYLFDALGSVVNLTTPGGSLLAKYQWDAWGNLRDSVETAANPFGFTGHEMDSESGLIYARARFYDPVTGRFLSHDPAAGDPANPPSLHRYLYAFQNPSVFVDPTGEESVTTLLEDELVDSLAEGDYVKATGVVAAKAFFTLADLVTVGFISRHDEARDQFEAREITEEEYWRETGKAAAKSTAIVAASVVTGGAAAVGARAVGLGATSTALVTGAVAGVGAQAGGDLVEGELSSAEDYRNAAVLGVVGGAIFRGGQALSQTRFAHKSVSEATRTVAQRVKASLTGESTKRAGARAAAQQVTRSAPASPSVSDRVRANIAESQRARAARTRAQARNARPQPRTLIGPAGDPGGRGIVGGQLGRSRSGSSDVLGPHAGRLRQLHRADPDFFPDPVTTDFSVVKGLEAQAGRAEFARSRLRGHHVHPIEAGGPPVPSASGLTFTGESTILRSKLEGVDLSFYAQGYGRQGAKTLNIYQNRPGGVFQFGKNPRHTEATSFWAAVRAWQRRVGLR